MTLLRDSRNRRPRTETLRGPMWLLSALLLGCDASVTTAPDAAVDVPAPSPPRTLDYAFTSLTIDESPSATAPHTGFNLDGRYSTQPLHAADCDHPDFFSALDPDQNENACVDGTSACRGGVDNQLPELASAAMMLVDFRTLLNQGVVTGAVAFLVRVEGVNDLSNDPDVTVMIFAGHPMFASCGSIGTPGQPYAIEARSFTPDGAPRYRFAARIDRGRLSLRRATGAPENVFVLPMPPIRGTSRMMDLHAFNLRATLTEDHGADGNLGGYVLRDDLFNVLWGPGFGALMYRTVIEGLVAGLVDVQTVGSCDAPNGGVSMGMGFALTRAVIQPTLVAGPVPGMCGTEP